MPLYEYSCRKCHRRFEALVRGGEKVVCEHCGSADIEKLISSFATASADAHPACAEQCPQYTGGGAAGCACGCGGHCHGH